MPKMPLDLAIKKTSLEWKKEDLVSLLRETAHKVVELAERGTLAHISETEQPCLQIRIMKNSLIALKEFDLLIEELERDIRRSSPV